MKKALILSFLLLAGLALAGPASAQTYQVPCFEWNCTSGDCDFDAGNCSPGGGAWYYYWTFGDGSTDFTTGPTTSYYYPGGHTATVTLKISYFGQPDDSTSCSVHYRNVIGPPLPTWGDCDYDTGCNCQ